MVEGRQDRTRDGGRRTQRRETYPPVIRVMQTNLNRNKAAWDLALQTAEEKKIDVLMVAEPNKARAKSAGAILDLRKDVAILVTGRIRAGAIGRQEGVAALRVGKILLVAGYSSPNISIDGFKAFMQRLEILVGQARGRCIVCGDFNAKSPVWGSRQEDARGRYLADAFAAWDMSILNEGGIPTFVRGNSASHLDVTAVSKEVEAEGTAWEISCDENLSDHRNIFITLGVREEPPHNKKTMHERWKVTAGDKQPITENLRRQAATRGQQDGADAWVEAVTSACRQTLRSVQSHTGRQMKYWWTAEIADLRRECTAARRRLERRSVRSMQLQTEELAADCRRRRNMLRTAILKAKENCWKKLLEDVEGDVWGKAYSIACRRMGSRRPKLDHDEQWRWAQKFFPKATEPRWERFMGGPHQVPPVTNKEVISAAAKLSTGKAPGPNGIPSEVIKWAVDAAPDWVARTFTRLLKEGTFYEPWKKGQLVLIPKGSTTGEVSYRPLCLLDTAGKLYEQVLLARMREELESGRDLSERQHGFRPGRSTDTAFRALEEIVGEVRRRAYSKRPVCAMVTVDIKNAFNSAPWGTIMEQLLRRGFSSYIVSSVGAYLRGRSVLVGEEEMHMSCGVPQGSVLGPTLWNIMYDPVLDLAVPDGVTLLGYADDLALVGVGKNREQLEGKLNDALSRVTNWMEEVGLDLAAHKTEAVILVGSRRMGGMRVKVSEHDIVAKLSLKYLGVWVGREYRFGLHITKAIAKAEVKVKSLARLMPNMGGPREVTRRVLCSVAAAQVLYAAPFWRDAMRHKKHQEAVNRLQRRMALRITSSYRTVSGPAVMVVARVFPLHLLAKERATIAADGNMSREVAREETLNSWQGEWETDARGAWTRRLIPNIRGWYTRRHGEVDHWLSQLLTGHGAFGEYLHRFHRRQTPACLDCGEDDSVEHTFFGCLRWEAERRAAWSKLGLHPEVENVVEAMLQGPEEWKTIAAMARQILTKKVAEDLGRIRPQ